MECSYIQTHVQTHISLIHCLHNLLRKIVPSESRRRTNLLRLLLGNVRNPGKPANKEVNGKCYILSIIAANEQRKKQHRARVKSTFLHNKLLFFPNLLIFAQYISLYSSSIAANKSYRENEMQFITN